MDRTSDKRRFVKSRRYEVTLVRYYNLISGAEAVGIEDIPRDVLLSIAVYNYTQLCRPLVARDLLAGSSIGICRKRYGVSEGFVRSVAEQL